MPTPSLRWRSTPTRLAAVLSATTVLSGALLSVGPVPVPSSGDPSSGRQALLGLVTGSPAEAAERPGAAGSGRSAPVTSLRTAVASGAGDLEELPRGQTLRAPVRRAALRSAAPRTTAPAAPRVSAPAALAATRTARINIRFVNTRGNTWSPQAKAAFRAAADVWERSIESRVPIEVEATARSLGAGLLGGAGPYDFLRNEGRTVMRSASRPTAAELRDDVFEPVALYNARTGRDALPPAGDELRPDIVADFNPNLGGLYLGTDGRPAANQVDFRTVVLHEIAHGLGMTGTATLDGTRAYVGVDDINGGTGVRSGVSFDQFTYATPGPSGGIGGRRVLSLPDGSAALRTALTGGQLYWAGQQALTAAGGTVQLHAPSLCGEQGPARACLRSESPFVEGTSYSHLDEQRYARGTAQGLMTPYLEEGEAYATPGQVTLGMLADMGWTVPALTGHRFSPVEPARVLDTRTGTGVRAGLLGAGALVDLPVADGRTVPAAATAVVLALNATSSASATDLRVFPAPVTPSAEPELADLVLSRAATRAGLVTVPVGRSGRVRVRTGSGALHLSADVVGWYGPGATSTFTAVDPQRLLDTRRSLGTAVRGAVGPGGQVDLRIPGVPAGTSAVALSVTALGATAPTDVRVHPGGGPRSAVPALVSLNASSSAPVVAQVVVRLGPDGTVRLRNAAGRVHLVADLVGVYSAAASGSLFRTVTAERLLDTRLGIGTAAGTPALLGAGRSVVLSGGGGTGVPRTATAAALTVTASGARTRTDVRTYPYGLSGPPLVSQLSVTPGTTVAESFVVRLGAGSAVLRNSAGTVALTVTASGWFGPPS